MAQPTRTYIIQSASGVQSANDYGKAVVKAHSLGEGARILTVAPDLSRMKCVKVIHFPYPKG